MFTLPRRDSSFVVRRRLRSSLSSRPVTRLPLLDSQMDEESYLRPEDDYVHSLPDTDTPTPVLRLPHLESRHHKLYPRWSVYVVKFKFIQFNFILNFKPRNQRDRYKVRKLSVYLFTNVITWSQLIFCKGSKSFKMTCRDGICKVFGSTKVMNQGYKSQCTKEVMSSVRVQTATFS